MKHRNSTKKFLFVNYRYHIEFAIPWNGCVHNEDKSNAPALIVETNNPNCKIIELSEEKDGLK